MPLASIGVYSGVYGVYWRLLAAMASIGGNGVYLASILAAIITGVYYYWRLLWRLLASILAAMAAIGVYWRLWRLLAAMASIGGYGVYLASMPVVG